MEKDTANAINAVNSTVNKDLAYLTPSNPWLDAWYRFRGDRLAVVGAIVFGLIVLAALIGPLVYGASATEIDYGLANLPPSVAHPFGTNDRGQDLLARVLQGGRVSLTVGLAAMVVATGFGTTVGAIAGFYGGWIDGALMRLTDLFLALPQLPLLLLVVYLFRDSLRSVAGPEAGIFILV